MRDADVTPIVDADTARRAIATAQDAVCGALRGVARRLGRGAIGLTVHERKEARTLDELGLQASELHAVQAASSEEQLLKRAGEHKARADDIVRRLGKLQAFAPRPPAHDLTDEPHRAALADLLDAIDAANRELASAAPDDGPFRMPYAWVYDARLLSHGLGHYANLFDQLAGWIQRSQAAERAEAADHARSLSDAEATALAEHLAALRRRLPAAANAARLAARRCSLVELKELALESPTTKLQIDDHEIAITLDETKPANGYALRVDHSAYPDPFMLYSDDELAGVIAEAAGLDLSDLAQRRRAHRGAQLARRRLAAIVAYRATHDRSHTARFDRARRSANGQKHPAAISAATPRQVAHEGVADVARQRQTPALVALAVDLDLPGPPVQIAKLKPRHLDRAQTEPREQREDREITRPDNPRSITGPEQPFNLRARRELGNVRLAPARDRRHRVHEARIGEAPQTQKTQQRAQPIGVARGGRQRHTRALADQERRDVRTGQVLDPELVLR
jgi:hypothetical protein